MNKVTQAGIATVLNGILASEEAETSAMTQADLEKFWFFRFDPKASAEWNTYQFYDLLRLYAGKCRRWEEMHNGNVCVVERVRDTYLMPKIRQFVADIRLPNEAGEPTP